MSKFSENPSVEKKPLPKKFVPMTAGTLRLEVPERDGYHRHWFRGTPERIARARQAGYEFVNRSDVEINSFDLGGSEDGNTDLGSRVSVISGDLDERGNPGRLYLMECPVEFFEASQQVVLDANERVASAIRSGLTGAAQEGELDKQQRYTKGKIPDLFNPNKRRP